MAVKQTMFLRNNGILLRDRGNHNEPGAASATKIGLLLICELEVALTTSLTGGGTPGISVQDFSSWATLLPSA